MKHCQLFPLLLSLALSYSAWGQFFERNFQTEFYNEAEALRLGDNGDLLCITRGNVNSISPSIFLHRIGKQGNVFSFPLFASIHPVDYDWLPLPSGVVVTAQFFECDFNLPRRHFFFRCVGQFDLGKRSAFY